MEEREGCSFGTGWKEKRGRFAVGLWGCRALRSLYEKHLWSCVVQGHARQTPGAEAEPVKELWSCERSGGAALWAPRPPLNPAPWSCSTTLLPFLLRAPDATPSTSPITPTVMWALTPSLRWIQRPVTSPGAFWRSETSLLRLESANTQVGRVTWGGCELEGLGAGTLQG